MDKIEKNAVEFLKNEGYEQYASEPYEKWSKKVDSPVYGPVELRVRNTSENEVEVYGGRYSAKARRLNGEKFGEGFAVWFGNDMAVLHEEMLDEVMGKSKED